eukprot:scaffold9272_cov195-Amphora_coffeaeformis.AAC.16
MQQPEAKVFRLILASALSETAERNAKLAGNDFDVCLFALSVRGDRTVFGPDVGPNKEANVGKVFRVLAKVADEAEDPKSNGARDGGADLDANGKKVIKENDGLARSVKDIHNEYWNSRMKVAIRGVRRLPKEAEQVLYDASELRFASKVVFSESASSHWRRRNQLLIHREETSVHSHGRNRQEEDGKERATKERQSHLHATFEFWVCSNCFTESRIVTTNGSRQ